MTTIEIKIGSRQDTYVLFQTNAPQAYDHGAAIQLADVSYWKGAKDGAVPRKWIVERYLILPLDQLEWQKGRNASGLHTVVTEDLLIDERDIIDRLWKKLCAAKEEES